MTAILYRLAKIGLHVIASEAKQSRLFCGTMPGLLRRYAPRNDAFITQGYIRVVALFFLVCFFSLPIVAFSQPLPVPEGAKCGECGMSIDANSKFIGEVVTKDDRQVFFCDIGDMLFHFKSGSEKIRAVYVKDYVTGEWIDGRKALYVPDKKIRTPMSWGIAAFALESEARKLGNPVDFNGAFRLVK